ncbi:hypothetical protein XSR1_400027 [Xenorhabdus szentirmaii DSM 16338]|uniref:Uncharacterized protein n=1 Tax=Xenorhabdus szentirmaii DSM 16338 TaxID=1427518 RepID=W1J0E3_9GAMM|nr:hypothetical protein XSR1_400027 [Xenorhabdus szentirmaii DSM 16338]
MFEMRYQRDTHLLTIAHVSPAYLENSQEQSDDKE